MTSRVLGLYVVRASVPTERMRRYLYSDQISSRVYDNNLQAAGTHFPFHVECFVTKNVARSVLPVTPALVPVDPISGY